MSTWLKDKEIAVRFRVSVKTVRRWAQRGMPRVREGHVALYPAEECDAWLLGRLRGPAETGSVPARRPRRPGRPRGRMDI